MTRVLAAALAAAVCAVIPAILRAQDADRARQATAAGDWPRAIAEWQQLYVKGDPDAPGELCSLYFDTGRDQFDLPHAIDWCRRAAGKQDGRALYRMGLLYLAGLGVDRDAHQAQALCATAVRDPGVPAGFCLAAAAREQEAAAQAALQVPRPALPELPRIADPRANAEQNCTRAFLATPFDAAQAANWCGKAAAGGDGEAALRLGLMKLFGLGGPPELAKAAEECRRAQHGGARGATSFCLAAAAHLHEGLAATEIGQRTGAIDVNPTVGGSLPKTELDPYAVDRVLDAQHRTPTGLTYTCRLLTQWALFEGSGQSILQPQDELYGRPIVDYRPADFAALDQAAENCAKEVAPLISDVMPVKADESLLQNFADFRKSLPRLRARQAELQAVRREKHQEAALMGQVDRDYRTGRVLAPDNATAQESVCLERVSQAWRASGQNNGRRTLELRDSRLDTENGRFVARGTATVVDVNSAAHNVISASSFSCTFDQTSSRVANFQLTPGFAPTR